MTRNLQSSPYQHLDTAFAFCLALLRRAAGRSRRPFSAQTHRGLVRFRSDPAAEPTVLTHLGRRQFGHRRGRATATGTRCKYLARAYEPRNDNPWARALLVDIYRAWRAHLLCLAGAPSVLGGRHGSGATLPPNGRAPAGPTPTQRATECQWRQSRQGLGLFLPRGAGLGLGAAQAARAVASALARGARAAVVELILPARGGAARASERALKS